MPSQESPVALHTPVPNSGPNFNTLLGVAATSQKAWAVGVALNRFYFAHSLIEAWDGTTWKIARTPRLNSLRDILFSAASASSRDVWAVGEQQDKAGTFRTLAEHWNGRRWTVVQLPTAGLTGSLLQGVAIGGHQVWAVGQSDDAVAQARPLVEHLSQGKWTAQQLARSGRPDPGCAPLSCAAAGNRPADILACVAVAPATPEERRSSRAF